MLAEYKQAPKHMLLFFWFFVPKLLVEFERDLRKEKKKKKKKTCGKMTRGMNNLEIDASLCSALM